MINYRQPTVDDGSQMWELAETDATLDSNSSYSYLMMCRSFPSTCIVAEHNNQIIGFVTGYKPEYDEGVLFVWQIAVNSDFRSQNVAVTMLKELIAREENKYINYIEATITPDNIPSQRLFEKIACEFECEYEYVYEEFEDSQFPEHYKEGDKSRVVCHYCNEIKETTTKKRKVSFNDGTGTVNLLTNVCDDCNRVVAIPAQTTKEIKKAKTENLIKIGPLWKV